MFRSEEMSLAQVFLQTETAFTSISDLGELGLVEFQDLNPETNAFNRKFVNEVRRCDEMERRIRYVEKEVLRAGLHFSNVESNSECPMPRDMIDMEASLETTESELREVESNYEVLQKSRLELCELHQVLVKANSFLKEKPDQDTLGDSPFHGGPVEMHATLKLGFKAGVINRERFPAFERILWRACRGNVLLRFVSADDCLQDPITGEKVSKDVFVIFFQGEKLRALASKICEGFRATMYPCPDSTAERSKILSNVSMRLEDLRSILEETQQHRMRVLTLARANLPTWIIRVHKMKAVYHVLNKCNLDVTQKCLIAEIWCPTTDLDIVRHSLRKSMEKAGSTVPSILNCMLTKKEPPTFNRTNKFTNGFQTIVDAYGVGCYREVNPALYTIITFPFLFAVMFGDLGHGIIMMLFALTLVLNEKKLEANKGHNEIFDTFVGGRYIILLMGLFSIYTGLIYNDCFSKSFNIFGSSWSVKAMFENGSWNNDIFTGNTVLQLDPVVKGVFNGPYPFGIDPIWNIAP
uniref:V-type proton ATPase 116 kDa subunit a 1-like n=1 Tax=Myxine glutinosa TaxID=7769 RepID=UPI00358EF0F4